MRTSQLKSYSIDHIDDISKEVISYLLDTGVEHNLAVLSLCRTLVMICDEAELDLVCSLIDDLSEVEVDKIPLGDN